MLLPHIRNGHLQLTISSLKQTILDQTRQNGYAVPFGVYIHNLFLFFFHFGSEGSEKSLGTFVISPLIHIGYL